MADENSTEKLQAMPPRELVPSEPSSNKVENQGHQEELGRDEVIAISQDPAANPSFADRIGSMMLSPEGLFMGSLASGPSRRPWDSDSGAAHSHSSNHESAPFPPRDNAAAAAATPVTSPFRSPREEGRGKLFSGLILRSRPCVGRCRCGRTGDARCDAQRLREASLLSWGMEDRTGLVRLRNSELRPGATYRSDLCQRRLASYSVVRGLDVPAAQEARDEEKEGKETAMDVSTSRVPASQETQNQEKEEKETVMDMSGDDDKDDKDDDDDDDENDEDYEDDEDDKDDEDSEDDEDDDYDDDYDDKDDGDDDCHIVADRDFMFLMFESCIMLIIAHIIIIVLARRFFFPA